MTSSMWLAFVAGTALGSIVTSILYTISNDRLRKRLDYIESLFPPEKRGGTPVKVRGRDGN